MTEESLCPICHHDRQSARPAAAGKLRTLDPISSASDGYETTADVGIVCDRVGSGGCDFAMLLDEKTGVWRRRYAEPDGSGGVRVRRRTARR